jgi:hypothetical protein
VSKNVLSLILNKDIIDIEHKLKKLKKLKKVKYKIKNLEKNREKCRKYYVENREYILKKRKENINHKKNNKKYYYNNKEKMRAKQIVYQKTKSGEIKKGNCFLCNNKKNIQGHHPDYTRPLYIFWLCKKCHNYIHRILRMLKKEGVI